MPTDKKIKALGFAIRGWRDAFAAARRMKVLAVGSFITVFLLELAVAAIGLAWDATLELGPLLLNAGAVAAYFTVYGVVVAPMAIAVIRHVVLDEVKPGHWRTLMEPRSMRFLGLSVLLYLLAGVALPFFTTLSFNQTFAYVARGFAPWPILITWGLIISATTILAIAITRSAILFAAIAVDAPRTTLRNAMLDTRGHSWQAFSNLLAAQLPLLLWYSVARFLPAQLAASLTLALSYVAIDSLLAIATASALAAVTARFYLAWSNTLGRPQSGRKYQPQD